MVAVRIITDNECDNPARALDLVSSDLRQVRATMPEAIGLQEIRGVANYAPVVRRVFRGWSIMGIFTPVALVIAETLLTVKSKHRRLMHRGYRKITPSRWCVWAVTEPRLLRGARLTVMNTHMINGNAHNPSQRANHASTAPFRARLWERHRRRMSRIIAAENKAGRSVILTGDFNVDALPKFLGNQVELAGHGIDHTLFFPAGTPGSVDVTVVGSRVLRGLNHRTSDHLPVVVDLELSRRRA